MEDDTVEIQNIIIECGDQKYEVNKEFLEVSGFVKDYLQLQLDENENQETVTIKVNPENVAPKILEDIIKWVKSHNYKLPKIKQIRSQNLKVNLDSNEINYAFASKLDPIKDADLIRQYYNAAVYFRITEFVKLLAARCATDLYFVNNTDYSKVKQNFNVEKDITIEQQEQLYKDEPWTQLY